MLWITSLTTLGFVLGENAWIKEQLEWIILGLVLITTLPVAFKMFFSKKKTGTGSIEKIIKTPSI